MRERISINSWIDKFEKGDFDSKDVKTQIQAGWYDWFCKDTSLAAKTKRMGRFVKTLKGSKGKVDLDNWYVWFKNNCPLNGPLYDDFRFANLETGDVQFTIQLDCCWNSTKYAVFGRTPDGEGHWDDPLFATDNPKELIAWLRSAW